MLTTYTNDWVEFKEFYMYIIIYTLFINWAAIIFDEMSCAVKIYANTSL